MSEETMFRQLRTIYRFPFQSPHWQSRYLIGAGLSILGFIIPIAPWIFLAGYGMRILRHSLEGKELELPEWEGWGELALDGLRYLVITVIFLLPAILVFTVGMGIYFFSFFAGVNGMGLSCIS